MDAHVHFIGLLRSGVSWAKVGRELIVGLAGAGAHVSAVALKGFLHDERFPLPAPVREALDRKRRAGWDLSLDYPPNFARLDGKRRAGILIYEADRFPPHWAEAVSENLDLAFVPSEFTLKAAVASGIPPEMLAVAPFGVNGQVYRPDGPVTAPPTGHSFNFLAVAAPHIRKGLAELTAAFTEAFTPADDVGLVIKCPPLQTIGKRQWEYGEVSDFLPEGCEGQITLLDGVLSEEEMAALYRGADVYVQPSYGESFGLAPLEALACGKPVIATGWGGVLEYLDETNSWLIDYDLIDGREFAYDSKAPSPACMARPRTEALAALLQEAYENADARRRKAAAGLETAACLPWSRTAGALLDAFASRLS